MTNTVSRFIYICKIFLSTMSVWILILNVAACGFRETTHHRSSDDAISFGDDFAAQNPDGYDFTLAGSTWKDRRVTFSFMPDGTTIAGSFRSDMMARFDSMYARVVWQNEFRRAFSAWAAVSPLTFTEVSDDGSADSVAGLAQGDPRFGDIRIGGYNFGGGGILASAGASCNYPSCGNVTFNTYVIPTIGSMPDLFSVALHEIGHTLGLGHSSVHPAVMEGGLWGVYPGPYEDDINAIRAAYPTVDVSPPTVSILTPANGATVLKGSTVNIEASATDNAGVAKVVFQVNNATICTVTVSPYRCAWIVPKSGRSFTIKAAAYDAAGNSASVVIGVVK